MCLFGGEPDGAGVAVVAGLPTGRADTAVSGAIVDVLCEQLRDGGGLPNEEGRELRNQQCRGTCEITRRCLWE
jgi:hypothetical protein